MSGCQKITRLSRLPQLSTMSQESLSESECYEVRRKRTLQEAMDSKLHRSSILASGSGLANYAARCLVDALEH